MEIGELLSELAQARGSRPAWVKTAADEVFRTIREMASGDLERLLPSLGNDQLRVLKEITFTYFASYELDPGWDFVDRFVYRREPAQEWEDFWREFNWFLNRATAEELKAQLKGMSFDDLGVFYLGLDSLPRTLPPGHGFYRFVGVNSLGQWRALPEWHRVKSLILALRDTKRVDSFGILVWKVMRRHAKRGEEPEVPPAKLVAKAVGAGLILPAVEIKSGEGQEPLWEAEDPAGDRFIREVEDADEAERKLEPLVPLAHFTRAEHIIYAGMRQRLEGEQLKEFAGERGLSRRSVPVLKARVIAKLREVAKPQ